MDTPHDCAFIETLTGRLQSLLPNRTGHSVAEVELNPQFIVTKSILLNIHTARADAISYIFRCFGSNLSAINDEANGTRVQDRDERSLGSTLVLCRVLSEILKNNWKREKTLMNIDHTDLVSNYSRFYYYDRPNPIDPDAVVPLLDIFISLLSPNVMRKVLLLMTQCRPLQTQHLRHHYQQHLRQSYLILRPAATTTIYTEDIDNQIEVVLRFLSSANPEEYYDYIYNKIFKYSVREEIIPFPVLQKYAPLVKFMFFSRENSSRIAEDITRAVPLIKSVAWKQAFILFLAYSIKDQTFSRTQDYDYIIRLDRPEMQQLVKNLFDFCSTIYEDSLTAIPCGPFTLTWLVILCLEDFVELDCGKPLNKLRIAFNKRLKFLVTILKDSSNLVNLESFDSLINMFHLAARLEHHKLLDHPVYAFSLKYLDTTHTYLIKYGSHHLNDFAQDEEFGLKYDYLLVNFYIAALMLKPDQYLNIIIQNYNSYRENLKEVKIIIKIIKGLSELENARPLFEKIMQKMALPLKSMIFGSIKLLRQYDLEKQQVSSSQSSAASLFSDIISIESGHFGNSAEIQFSKKTILDHYINEISPSTTSNLNNSEALQEELHTHTHSTNQFVQDSSSQSSTTLSRTRYRVASTIEEILADAFHVFIACPDLYFNDFPLMSSESLGSQNQDELLHTIVQFCQEIVVPLRYAFKTKSVIQEDSRLFDAACALSMRFVDEDTELVAKYTVLSTFANYTTSNYIIQSICEAGVSLSLTDPKFKSIFLFINKFLQRREAFNPIICSNKIILDPNTSSVFEYGGGVVHAIEKILLLSLCTHDIQFYNIAKVTMKWYCNEVKKQAHLYKNNGQDIDENLLSTFEQVINDDFVFTGFVSLHKRFRNILRDAKPTKSLYQVWLVIYNRWLEMLDNKTSLNDENLVFRHFTGFLVSTSGCFLSEKFSINDPDQKEKSAKYISEFFDKCISLLTSQDLVIRVVVKDVLSNESHSDVYHLISTKLMNVANQYSEKMVYNDEAVLYIEQALVIITTMISIRNDGAFLLVSFLPTICEFFLKFISMLDNVTDQLRLKLRFCKLGIVLETNRSNVGLQGAFKLRNFYAKASAEWLESSVFGDENGDDSVNTSSNVSVKSGKDSEIAYLKIDLAVQCSKCLSLQVEEIVLEVPDGTKDSEIRKYKDIAFGNYFSLFYKIIQKYAASNITSGKSRHKLNQISDHVLKSISNILQYDTDIGMQFVLPMGYHENKKIRSIFLNVFSNMLASRKNRKVKEDFSESLTSQITDLQDIFGAIAEVASSTEHNLLASSLFGIFSYTKKLDNLFKVLLYDEVNTVSRSTDIFRRNSVLTRLLSNYARDHGLDYLENTLKPVIEDIVNNEVIFEVEKVDQGDSVVFMKYFNKLVDSIVSSAESLPDSFKFICAEVYRCVQKKFEDAALIAVGSFVFLRFLCPAIISPEAFFGINVTNPKVKRTLMQLVKVLQNTANGSLGLLKWPGLSSEVNELNNAQKKIFEFLKHVATQKVNGYPFQPLETKPVAEMKYLCKFIYTYFTSIKTKYLTGKINGSLHHKVSSFRVFDKIVKELGHPKPSVQLQITSPFKNYDPNNSANNQYNDFMTKMSMNQVDRPTDYPVIHISIFGDGTPVVTVNFKYLKSVENDVYLLVYKLFETASQVWENKFYMVFDFTEFIFLPELGALYVSLVKTYAPEQLFKNCARIYYFNVPRSNYEGLTKSMKTLRMIGYEYGTRIYTYSQVDSPEIITKLCLDPDTLAISRDTKVTFNHAKLYDVATKEFLPISIRIGRKWIQICSEDRVIFKGELTVTDSFVPVDVYRLSDITKCEISRTTDHDDEFSIYLNYEHQVVLRSYERSEILRFLYFTTSRLPKQASFAEVDKDMEHGEHKMHWFGRLYNIVFQGLLCNDEDVRSSASILFGSLSTYFDIDFRIKSSHARSLAFPADSTSFVVSISTHLARGIPEMSYRFFKAFFDNYEKLPEENKLSSIIYISPWIDNVYDYICLENEENGPGRVAELVRQFCRISFLNKEHIAFLNDYIWKKLFSEPRLASTLVDEVVAFAIDNKNDGPDWSFIIAVISPSIEVCGEVVSRLITAVGKAKKKDSAIAAKSKLFEIRVLVKICASLFFNSYALARLYLPDIVFFCTLFIDNMYLDFGADLQKLVINIIQSFLHKPDLSDDEQQVVDETIDYFSSQRAKMLFGVTRDISNSGADASQLYNRASNFEVLCDYLNDFIGALGSAEDKTTWRATWCSYAIDVAFSKESTFQSRAILVVGILSKSGINDSTACRSLKLIANGDISTLDFTTSISIATARILDGLPATSILPPVLIWPQFCFGLMNCAAIYQPSIQCLVTAVVKIIEIGSDYVEKAFQQRVYLEPYISDFEKSHNYEITRENFGVHIFFTLTQGLRVSQFRHTSVHCLQKYFKVRYKHRDRTSISGFFIYNNAIAYLVFIYLSLSDAAFEEYLEEIGLDTDYVVVAENVRLPSILVDFLLMDTDAPRITLIHAAYFYDSKSVDNLFKTKFLHIFDYLFQQKADIGFMIYHIVKSTLEENFLNTTSLDVVDTIANIMNIVYTAPNYSVEVYKKQVRKVLEDNKVTVIGEDKTMRKVDDIDTEEGFEVAIGSDMRKLQMMLYRSACLFVEGSRLED
ncbi:Ras GTPase activating protein RasGAP/neurofibromin [Scheffersomyces stipitis CBS 6054]|uniref:Ras GTPase activating protein RasGAP/neurofibromin n=1 Tax=Scheffersomyces stipitis (strain ATCC 58785 / CBS 6054 / NBRC 10063 / NRRL Y-11545) TaxID=322104 RepID=A3GHY3_PICST|nr:Ras GTPase activating protein RasGAP/neurofibromin [Scheffersomyces stipitis CBS 6054]EAZ62896.2 Ras GTPase activating protein RasGAP/neurofibromin [Scheffersomyces stipitis CBS 6054]